MTSFLVILKGVLYGLHVLVCLVMILAILLQAGKSAGIGTALGGAGSQTLFGAGGGQGFLARFTTAAAIIFMFTSIGLAKLSTPSEGGLEKKVEEQKAKLKQGKGEEVKLEELGVSVMPEEEAGTAPTAETQEIEKAVEEALAGEGLEPTGESGEQAPAPEEAGGEEGETAAGDVPGAVPAEDPGAAKPAAKKPEAATEPAAPKPAKKPEAATEPAASKPAKKPEAATEPAAPKPAKMPEAEPEP